MTGISDSLWGPLFSQRFKLVPKAGQVLPAGRLHRATAATSAAGASMAAPAARTALSLENALQQTTAPLNLKALLYDARAFSRFRAWVHKRLLPRVPLAAGMPFVAAALQHPALAGDESRTPGMHITVAVHHRDGCVLPSSRLLHSSSPAFEAAHGNILDRNALQAGETVERCLQLRVVVQNTHPLRLYTVDFGGTSLQLRTGAVSRGEVDRLAFCDAKAVAPQRDYSGTAETTTETRYSSVYTFTLRHNDTLSMVLSFPLAGVKNEASALELCHRLLIPATMHKFKQRVKLAELPKCSCAGGHFDAAHFHSSHLDDGDEHTDGHHNTEKRHEHAHGTPQGQQAAHFTQRTIAAEGLEISVPFVESDVVWSHYRYISGHFLVLEEKDLVSGV